MPEVVRVTSAVPSPVPAVKAAAPRTSDPKLPYRPDIQGLRALAILAVVLYHVHLPGVGGGFIGVDFFFVLSGFLITGLLVAEVEATGRVRLMTFWGRRARRLVPASGVALAATAVVAGWVLPLLDRRPVAIDTLWAAGFSANWRFVQQQTDYLAQDRAPSPVLHYWSLGVEEQYYVVWPVLIALVCLVLVLRRRLANEGPSVGAFRPPLVVALLLVVVASFAWNVHEVSYNQPAAFFGTFARVWQLGVGAVLAVLTPSLRRLSLRTRAILALAGVFGFLVSVVAVSDAGSGSRAYPGWWALLPTLAAGALLTAGVADQRLAVSRWLSFPVLRWIGDRSYSWYLWHWPALILGVAWLGHDDTAIRLVLAAGSLGLAVLSYRYVETPLRRSPGLVGSPAKSLMTGGVFILIAVLGAGYLTTRAAEHPTFFVVNHDGKRISITPTPANAAKDAFSLHQIGCDVPFDAVTAPACDFGDLTSDRDVVLVGDSHAGAIFPAVQKSATEDGWHLNAWTKAGCPFADVTKWDKGRRAALTQCDTFRTNMVDRIIKLHPSVVLIANAIDPTIILIDRTTQKKVKAAAAQATFVQGLHRTVQQLAESGIKVVVVRDFPRATEDLPSCLLAKKDVDACSFPRPATTSSEYAAVKGLKGASVLDLDNTVCDATTCRPVQGHVLAYRDTNHITMTFALTLAHYFSRFLPPAKGASP